MPRRDDDARSLRGRGLSPNAPGIGAALIWNGTLWLPGGNLVVSAASLSLQATSTANDGSTVSYQKEIDTVGAQSVVIDSFTPPASSGVDVVATVIAVESALAGRWKQDVEAFFTRDAAAGSVAQVGANTPTTPKSTGTVTGFAIAIATGNANTTIDTTVTSGVAGTVRWTVNFTYFYRTNT